MKKILTPEQTAITEQFQKHIDAEIRGDLETTLATMTDNPHLNNIPTMIGGIGKEGVKAFYGNLIPFNKFFPPDLEMVPVSQTIDQNQLVDEIIFKFTHTTEVGWMLPNIPPTGKRVEIPLVVIVGFENGKVTHEHIYWDQASVLVQVGLLDPVNLPGLPIHGIETAKRMDEIRKKMNND
ncbi:MAG: carboxymethylenebutenolidase [Bacteroidetes bacterium]|nr:carboxymethylenebutenolidase [Bacteroidota bacterium]